MEKEVAKILLKLKAVLLKPNEPFTWTSGIKAPIYCDNRTMISYPEERKQIVDYYIKKIEESGIQFDIIAGTSTAGIPWAAWIAEKMNKPMVYIRGKKKKYGAGKQIEGVMEEGQKVIVIEDLISTGGSSITAVEAVRDNGGIVDHCFAIFTYEFEKSKNSFEESNCNMSTLTGFSSLVESAVEQGYMQDSEKEAVLEWSKDPENWGK